MFGIIADTLEKWLGFILGLMAETLKLWVGSLCYCLNSTLELWAGFRVVRGAEYDYLFDQSCKYNHMRKKLESVKRKKSEQIAKLNAHVQELLDKNKWLTDDVKCKDLRIGFLETTNSNLREAQGMPQR